MVVESLLAEWTGPFGGVPPLDRIPLDELEPAMHEAMAQEVAEFAAIREQAEPPTFANTIEALERCGSALRRVSSLYHLVSGNYSAPAFREIQRRVAPVLASHRAHMRQDPAIYARILAVSEQPLTEVQRRLVDGYLRTYRHAGAHLAPDTRARVAAIVERLSVLYTTFSDHVLADEEGIVHFLDEDQLDGLSGAFRSAAKAAAAELGQPDRWAILNTRSSVEPFLYSAHSRPLREQVWRTFYARADNGDDNDNNELIAEILSLRAERAALLGYEHHAAKVLDGRMCATADDAFALMKQVWDAAVAKFRQELAAMAELADHALEPWDVRYYAEQVRKQRYDFDPAELLPYFQLHQLVDAMFWTATERFGWVFEPADIPLPHPDVRAWAVRDAEGHDIGVFYLDPFARKGKRSGAWMSAMRSQANLDHPVLPVVTNNCNFARAGDGPTLLTVDEARTLFHEFGHGLHGLASSVTWPSQAGTAVPRDFVEFPSQLNEHWLTTAEVLGRFALHVDTGEPPPQALLDRMKAANDCDAGFRTLEFLASAVMDMEMHVRTEPIDPRSFEREVLGRWGLPSQVVMRHRTPHFAHLFSGEAYSAGYYSYLWADALVADAAEQFAEVGFYDASLCEQLMTGILSRGDTIDPGQMFRDLRGRDPVVEPLLRDRGLA